MDTVASEFDISPNTICKWLSVAGVSAASTRGRRKQSSEALIISKLQREKQELLEIIGELTVLTKQSKKKSGKSLLK